MESIPGREHLGARIRIEVCPSGGYYAEVVDTENNLVVRTTKVYKHSGHAVRAAKLAMEEWANS